MIDEMDEGIETIVRRVFRNSNSDNKDFKSKSDVRKMIIDYNHLNMSIVREDMFNEEFHEMIRELRIDDGSNFEDLYEGL